MKKKFVSLFVAVAMVLALPSVAFAAVSPSNDDVSATDAASGVTVTVDSDGLVSGSVTATATDVQASNVDTENENIRVLASFEVTLSADGEIDPETGLTLTFSVGTEWAGYTAYVYIEHSDGTFETQEVTVSDSGTVSVTVYQLSTFTIAVDESTAPSLAADGSSTSPATGVNMLPVLCVTAAAVVGAGVCAVSLRKRLSK